MESCYIGVETFQDNIRIVEEGRKLLEKYPGDPGIKINIDSLLHHREVLVKELKRRWDQEDDLAARDVLVWLRQNTNVLD